MRKTFVAPKLVEEASLTTLTLSIFLVSQAT
jgi:hypothetical protein